MSPAWKLTVGLSSVSILPVLRAIDEFPQFAGVLRSCPENLAEVAQPEDSGEYPELGSLRAAPPAESVITPPSVASLETVVSHGEFGLPSAYSVGHLRRRGARLFPELSGFSSECFSSRCTAQSF